MRKPWIGVFRSGSIGDVLIVSSAIAQLAKEGNVEFLCNPPYRQLVEHDPHIAKLTEMPAGTMPSPEDSGNWFRKKAKEYDRFYNLSHSCEALLALSPAQTWFDWSADWRRKKCGGNYLEAAHEACGVPLIFDPGPRFYPSDEEIADARRVKGTVGERMIGVVLSGSRFDKIWPWMPQFVAKLLRDVKLPVVLFGGPEHDVKLANTVYEVVKQTNGNVDDLHTCITRDDKTVTAEWSMRRNLAQIQECDLIITPDTGLAWGVAMSPMPKIMLLSHASPENITKHWRNTVTLHADQERVQCWPCHQLHSETTTCTKAKDADAAACITDIHDTVVMDLVIRLLDQHKGLVVPMATMNADEPGGYVGLRRIEAAE